VVWHARRRHASLDSVTTAPYNCRLWSPRCGRLCGCGLEPFHSLWGQHYQPTRNQMAPQLCSHGEARTTVSGLPSHRARVMPSDR